MPDAVASIALALAAFEVHRTPAKITAELRARGRTGLVRALEEMPAQSRDAIEAKALEVSSRGISVVMLGDDDYPARLDFGRTVAAPILFYRGNPALFEKGGIGMCGSRNVSELGMTAARTCGFEVSRRKLVVVSGYAKGVDTETHLAALRSSGSTIIVLAEGFDHFRIKREFAADFDPERTLVLSQFPPSQPWGAYAAMARNAVIFGLGLALVVIEAGEKGGTLAAGEGALKVGRPVYVLDFGDTTPAGNRKLLDQGSLPVRSPSELGERLDSLRGNSVARLRPDALF